MHITKERLDEAFSVTNRAFAKIRYGERREIDWNNAARDFYDLANRYFEDASHFYNKGDLLNAFGAIYYAHGWLDAGARLGLFDVGGDSQLFTVDEEDQDTNV